MLNTTRHGTTRHGTTRHGTTRHDTTRHDGARFDLLRWTLAFGLLLSSCEGRFEVEGPVRPNQEVLCGPSDALPGRDALRRMTNEEYVRTLSDLFPGLAVPAVALPEHLEYGRYDTWADGQVASPLFVERALSNAETVADAAVLAPEWLGCGAAPASACVLERLPLLYARAFRRALSAEDAAALRTFLTENEAAFGTTVALRMGLEAMLSAPPFLYRIEAEDIGGAPSGYAALDDFELASRLSSFLWRSVPDGELLAVAESASLRDPDVLRAQAARMLNDPRARAGIRAFLEQWLQLSRLETAQSAAFPEFTPEVRVQLRESMLRYAEHAFWERDSVTTLLTGSYGFVNTTLAPLFGVPDPGTTELIYTELDPSQRRGILTQPGLLASTTHGATHSPVLRGLFILREVLCDTISPPPVDVNVAIDETTIGPALTTRERFEINHGTESCASCHTRIDGLGFGFEHYDGIGRYRTHENGVPVNSTGEVLSGGDADGPYDNAIGLVERLSPSRTVRECLSRQLYRYAMGWEITSGDACQVEALTLDLQSTDSLQKLVLSLIESPSFRYRIAATAPPPTEVP